MARPQKYPEEVIQRGIRLVFESGRPIAHVAHELGLPAETLRKRVGRAEVDAGKREGMRPLSFAKEDHRRRVRGLGLRGACRATLRVATDYQDVLAPGGPNTA